MPITKSAKKAYKRSLFLRERNLKFKIAMKKAIKDFRKAIEAGKSKEELKKLLQIAYSKIDRCGRRNIIHWKAAARKKRRLSKKLLEHK